MFLMENPKQKMDVLDPHLEAPQAVRARILRFFQGQFTGNTRKMFKNAEVGLGIPC